VAVVMLEFGKAAWRISGESTLLSTPKSSSTPDYTPQLAAGSPAASRLPLNLSAKSRKVFCLVRGLEQ
jgi:hypothetical protein